MRIPSALRAAGAAIACALIPAPASAVDQDIQLSATVASSCTISGSETPTALQQQLTVTAGQVDVTPITLAIPVSCNTGVEVRLYTLSVGLRTSGSTMMTSNRIDYTAHLTGPTLGETVLDTELISSPTEYAGGMQSSGAPNTDSMLLTITPKQPSQPLKTGAYSDTLRITLLPGQ